MKRWETCDLLLAVFKIFLVHVYNDTTQNLGQYIPNIIKHCIVTWLSSNIHFKSSKFINKSSEIWKVVLTIASSHDICHFKATTSKFYLSPTHTHFLAFLLVAMLQWPISLHAHWCLNSVIHYIFTATIYYSTSLHLLISHASHW